MISTLAVLTHLIAQTNWFTHSYWVEPNLYHTWPRVDEITHALSANASTSITLNLNLPMSYRKKWAVGWIIGMLMGSNWEISEWIAWILRLVSWIRIDLGDTGLDFHQDFYGATLAICVYIIIMQRGRILGRIPGLNGISNMEKS